MHEMSFSLTWNGLGAPQISDLEENLINFV